MTNLATAAESEPLWPATWVRALLPSAILDCVEDAPLHGYAIGQALGARGFGVPRGGSLYPALARLEESGSIVAEWVPGPSGPARRQYTLTPAGREHLTRDRAALGALTAALGAEPPGDRSPRTAEAPETRATLSHETPSHDAAIMAEGATGDL